MNHARCTILAILVWSVLSVTGQAYDTIKTTKKVNSTLTGKIVKMNSREVTLNRSQIPKIVPVNEIIWIAYDGESNWLNLARKAVANGRYVDAQTALKKVDMKGVDREGIKTDFEFYTALCAARLALAGTGTITAAGTQIYQFVKSHSDNYHWLDANEVLGDLLVAKGDYAEAQKYYTELEKAPWPDYKMRAGTALGRALLAQNKPAEALKAFEGVLALHGGTGTAATRQQMAATLGKARCLAETDKPDEAVKLIEAIIAKANPENIELHGQAYNTLGTTLRKAQRTKEAVLAFLHVSLLYSRNAEAHAEALANLEALWNQLNKSERALQARQELEKRYPNSPWVKKRGG